MKESKAEKRVEFFQMIARLITTMYAKHGIELMPFSFHRTREQQATYVEDGVSQTMRSKHLQWLAIDLVIVRNGETSWKDDLAYLTAGEAWEMMGGTWGGRWERLNDIYHFEYRDP